MGILIKIKKLTVNLSIVITSLIFVYLFFELIFVRFFLSWLPLKTHWFLNDPVRVLAQSSKKWTIPEDYIALLGDSHALGLGDWMLSVNDFLNPDVALEIAQRALGGPIESIRRAIHLEYNYSGEG